MPPQQGPPSAGPMPNQQSPAQYGGQPGGYGGPPQQSPAGYGGQPMGYAGPPSAGGYGRAQQTPTAQWSQPASQGFGQAGFGGYQG